MSSLEKTLSIIKPDAVERNLEEKIKLGEIAFQDSVDQQLQNFEGELVESKGSIEKKIEKLIS